VGVADGKADTEGLSDGDDVGNTEGVELGTTEGLSDGDDVGNTEGAELGTLDGETEGSELVEGPADGCNDGDAEMRKCVHERAVRCYNEIYQQRYHTPVSHLQLGENDGISDGLVEGKADSEGLADGEDCGMVENDGCNDGEAEMCT
jgi:hypothetical protein